MIIGIILAAGKGERFKSKDKNKTAVNYLGKPLILYSVELFESVCNVTFVVIGHFAESVKKALSYSRSQENPAFQGGDKLSSDMSSSFRGNPALTVRGGRHKKVEFVSQKNPAGTGDAVRCAVDEIKKKNLRPTLVLVGYGDHMMFYDALVLKNLIRLHKRSSSSVTMVTTRHSEPNFLAWGRIVRNQQGVIQRIVEQKDASDEEKKITELNAGLYCFDYKFIEKDIYNLKASPITGEYYLTDLIGIAIKNGLVLAGLEIPFEKVGIGINTYKEKVESERLFRRVRSNLSSS